MGDAAESGTAKFAIGPSRAMGHLETEKGELTVETITLDEAAKETGTCPDVIKIDVEGGEMEVFRGAHATIARSSRSFFSRRTLTNSAPGR
ncbi:MAG: FkbM family methyltransferase [Pyrinomonadaceae bacterium]